ncbi:MAG: hypothetical protein RLN76_13555 [Phycisphaeraceae bacterium]
MSGGDGHRDRIELPDAIPPEALETAIARYDREGLGPHGESTMYDVIVGGRTYAPPALIA